MNKKKSLLIAVAVAAVLAGILLILLFLPKGDGSNGGSDASTIDEGVDMTISTDASGVHQASVSTDEKGEIKNNSYGTLVEYVPAELKIIHIENKKGTLDVLSNTPEGEATVYTIKGYEDVDLQSGAPDKIANAASSIAFDKVASITGDDPGRFGLSEPRAKVEIYYNDGTKSILFIGDDAPQNAGTYVRFGSAKAVYLCDAEKMSAFDFGVNDLISLTINSAADSTENNEAQSFTLSGGGFDKDIVIERNSDEKTSASYKLTSPVSSYANEQETSKIEGCVRGLYAESVKYVNPSDNQLSKAGLASPYAKITAVYPDRTITLYGSKPDGDGKVNLMAEGGNVVYVIGADKAAWTATSFDKLLPEYVFLPKMSALSGMKVTAGGRDYDFALKTETLTKTDDQGSETQTTETTVTLGGKTVDLGKFTSFFDDVTLIKPLDHNTGGGSGTPELKAVYTFTDGSTDTVEFIPGSDDHYTAVYNGNAVGSCYRADVARAVNNVKELAK